MGCGSSVNRLPETPAKTNGTNAREPSPRATPASGTVETSHPPSGPPQPTASPPSASRQTSRQASRQASSTSTHAGPSSSAGAPPSVPSAPSRPTTPPVLPPARSPTRQTSNPASEVARATPTSSGSPVLAPAAAAGPNPPDPQRSGSSATDPQADVRERAAAFTTILVRKSQRVQEGTEAGAQDGEDEEGEDPDADQREKEKGEDSSPFGALGAAVRASGGHAARPPGGGRHGGGSGIRKGFSGDSCGSGLSGLSDELEALLGGLDHFPDLLKELMAAPTQVLLPGDVNPEDAAQLTQLSGCSTEEAVKLLDCLALLRAAADALPDPDPDPAIQDPAANPLSDLCPGPDPDSDPRGAQAARALATAGGRRGPTRPASAAAAAPSSRPASGGRAVAGGADAGSRAGAAAGAAGAAAAVPGAGAGAGAAQGPASGSGMMPSPQQLTRQLGTLSSLVTDYPGLRTAAMARDAHTALLRVLLRHTERAVAANAALALAALAAGPPPHKTSLIAAGAVTALLTAMRGGTAAAAANGGDAPGVAANAANAVANLASGHAAGAAAVAAGGGVETLIALLSVDGAANVRTNAAGVIVQLTAAHESYRAAFVAAGGVTALAAGMLRGPDAPACNAATALYNLAALSPPNLRPAMAAAEGQLSIAPQLLLCMSGRNRSGAADESVAASSAARINASAVLLELCKDPAAAPLLAAPALAVPSALAALAAGRLPQPPDGAAAAAAAADFLSGGVELLYPVPPVVRGNALLCLMALARMGPDMQLELGRCGALGTLLELIAPGQDPAMQINAANAICSLAAANADIHAALVSARCVPLLAGLLQEGGDAARANVCATFVTMMVDAGARKQLQECGGLAMLIRLVGAILDQRLAAGLTAAASADPGGVLCNCVGALAEAAKHADLRRGLMQVEFGESLGTLLRCLREGPEPAQVNAAAALCHLCREQACAAQLGRQNGVEALRAIAGSETGDGAAPAAPPGGPSARLRHNARRALVRLEGQLAAAESDAAHSLAAARAAAADAAVAATTAAGVEGGAGAAAAASEQQRPPRRVWDGGAPGVRDSAASLAVSPTPPTRTEAEAESADDAEDAVSTVITPPLPLAAY